MHCVESAVAGGRRPAPQAAEPTFLAVAAVEAPRALARVGVSVHGSYGKRLLLTSVESIPLSSHFCLRTPSYTKEETWNRLFLTTLRRNQCC